MKRKIFITEKSKVKSYYDEAIDLIMKAPDYEYTLSGWGEVTSKALVKAAKSFVEYKKDVIDFYLSIASDFYRGDGKSFMNAMVDKGISGLFLYGDDAHILVLYDISLAKEYFDI